MNKMGKRFVALVIVFASIISFLPIKLGLNGQAVQAMTTQIQVSGTPTVTGDKITTTNGEYITQQQYSDFTLAVDYKVVNQDNIEIGQTGVVEQEVIITSIDGIELDGDLTSKNEKLAQIGCSISNGDIVYTGDTGGNKTIGVTITDLPYGINKIKYKIRERTVTNKGQQDPNNIDGKIDLFQPPVDTFFPSSQTTKEVVIQHGNGFVQSQVPYIDFVDYIGGRPADPDTTLEDNKTPFQYMERVLSIQGKSLKFEHDLPNSVTDMDYKISFPNGVDTQGGDVVFINGSQATDVGSSDDKILTGSLKKTSTSTLLVIAIKHDKALENTYSIEIQYNNKIAENDYALKDAGITKFNYNADSAVKAFVGKQFITKTEDGLLTYEGEITISKQAGMISMEPIIGRSSANTAFKISNHYDGDIVNSKLINGKQYVDFAKGINNEIWLEIYEGSEGNIKGKLLAIYKLRVNFVEDTVSSTVRFSVDNNSILTQPGRAKTEKIEFDANRRTYDLHFVNDTNSMSITLDDPKSYDNGNRREYIRAWGGTSALSDNVTEISGLGKEAIATIDITKYKKILVQAYYDQIIYKEDTNTGEIKEVSRTPYPIGQKYTFYIAKNADVPDDTDNTDSNNAALSDIKASNGNIKATDGTSGFSSDKINYNVTVPKIDTSSEITVTAENSKVKDISATIVETGDEYGLTSGEPFDFPLNSTGITNIKIVVTAQDGIASKTYNLTIINDTRSASALLKNVITDNGDFTFDPEKDPNKIRVDQVINKLNVSPIAEDSKSKITVNGTKFSGSPITIDLKGSQKTDMEIKVTSEDGSESKTYYFEIYRTDTPINDIDDGNSNEDDLFYDEIDDCWVDLSKYEEWGTVKGKAIYFNNKGRQVKDRWISTKGIWYYLNSKGYKATGWRKEVGGKTYYLDSNTGELRTGWMNQNNKWYYLGLNGVMHKGWLYLNQNWYYFTPEGEMLTNQSMFINNKVFRFGQDGAIY